VIAVGLLVGALIVVLTIPLPPAPPDSTTTTSVIPTLPDTVRTLPPVTDPHVGTSIGG
jgi:hypothetical protein